MVSIKNNTAESLMASVWNDIERRRLKEAAIKCSQINKEFPLFAPGWHAMSYIALQLNNSSIALDAIDKAVNVEPGNSEWLLQKANCLMAAIRLSEAKDIAVTLLNKNLTSAYQCSTLARIFVRLDSNEQALGLYKKAIALSPKEPGDYYNLATVQRSLGHNKEAEENLNKCLKINPKDSDAYYVRSLLREQSADSNNIDSLRVAIDSGVKSPKAAVKMQYALAKELEDVGQYDESFEALKLAADLRRKNINYQVEGDLMTMDAIKNTYNKHLFESGIRGFESEEPIFILGMPRTGTTLIERILGSHDQVFSAGELNNFAYCLMKQVGEVTKKKLNREELVSLSSSLDFSNLGESYMASTRNVTGDTPKFIDKLPLNFLYVGLIHLAIPKAKIINLQRNPMDTCYAIYKSLFEDGYPFSYDLSDLGRYYIAYHQLMAHWNEVLPGVIHTVNYESVVSSTEEEAKKLIQFCDLEWQDQCLRFYENKTASTTASASQIRKPIYSSSVGKWQKYKEQLQPLVSQLQEAGIEV